KTLITFIGACLPIESASALQMGCLGAVVLGAQLLYCRCHPYHTSEWNWIEISLLSAAMVMIIGVSTLLANEAHWGHTLPTQLSIILGTALIAAVASTTMTYLVIKELIREHSQK
ncbi:pmpB, partial [Symbiodinium sp. CCMP2456]